MPGWDSAFATLNTLAAAGPTSWTAAQVRRNALSIWELQQAKGVQIVQAADGGRLADGYERTLEDLLGSSDEVKNMFRPGTVYVPFDGDKLIRSYEYGWFNRMSQQQILESEFVWAKLAKNVKVNTFAK
jgi:hypothetical protein